VFVDQGIAGERSLENHGKMIEIAAEMSVEMDHAGGGATKEVSHRRRWMGVPVPEVSPNGITPEQFIRENQRNATHWGRHGFSFRR
jgi:hypothetical protein